MADATVTPRIPLQTPMFDDAGNLTRPWILFFEQFGTPGADGAPGEPAEPPENVTFVLLVKETRVDDQGNTYLHVTATYNPPDPIGTFTGIHTYVEAPDQALLTPRPDPIIVDVGEQQYLGDPDGTVIAPDFTRYGVITYDFYPSKIEDWRFYLVPFSEFVENKLVPEQDPPDPDATPNKVISVAPGAVVPPGTEIPGDLIPIDTFPFLITVAVSDPDGNALRRQVFTITYDPPNPVPPFTGVAVDIQTPGQVAAGEAFAAGNQEYSGDETASDDTRRGSFQLNLEFAQHGGELWTFYLSPYSASYRIPLDANKGAHVGTTANRSITALSDAEGAPGIEWADQVLDLAVTVEYEYQPMVPGWKWRLNGTWTNPDDIRFGGSKQVIREYPAPTPDPSSEDRIPSYYGPQDDHYTTFWYDLADPQTWWDNFQPSIDILKRENSILVTDPAIPPASRVIPPDCPCVRVEVSEVLAIASLRLTRREGEEYASNVTGQSTIVTQVWDDVKGLWTYYITCKWTNPDPSVDPRFGGLDLVYRADGTEDIITPIFYQVDPGVPYPGEQTVDLGLGDEWESPAEDVPFTMYFRSFDFGGQDNSIVDGVTPDSHKVAFKSPAVGLITDFTMRVEYGDNGAVLINDPTFTPPNLPASTTPDPSFWYAELWMRNLRWIGQLSEMARSHDLAIIGENFPPGPASETWEYWGVSVSYDLRKNPDPFDPAVITGTNYTTKLVGPAPEVGAPMPPDNVTIILPITQETLQDDTLNDYLHIVIKYNPPTPIGTFTGVHVFIEAPDQSAVAGRPDPIIVDHGAQPYFGDPAGTVTTPDFTRYGVIDLTFYPANDELWRFYLVPFSEFVEPQLVTLPDGGAHPNVQIHVVPASSAAAPVAPADVTIVSLEVETPTPKDDQENEYLHVTIKYARPSPVGSFIGVDVDVEAPDQPNELPDKRIIVPIGGGWDYANNVDSSGNGVIDLTFYPTKEEDWRFYLSSYSTIIHNALVVRTVPEPGVDANATPNVPLRVAPGAVAAAAPPGNVTIQLPIQQTTLTDEQGNGYIHVRIKYARPSPVGTFVGVNVDVEAPDQPSMAIDKRIIVPEGGWDYANNVENGTGFGVLDLTFYPTKTEDWRFYLSSYSTVIQNTLVVHQATLPNDPNQTPNGVISVVPATLAAPAPPANVTFKTITQNTLVDSNGDSYLHVVVQYDPPAPFGSFVGVDVDVEAPDQPTQPVAKRIIVPVGGFDYNGDRNAQANSISRLGTIDLKFYPGLTERWRFYLSSYSVLIHNTLVVRTVAEPGADPNATPNQFIDVTPAPISAPTPAGYVNFISIASETLTDDEKNPYTHITILYDRPSTVGTFMGVDVNVEAPDTSKIIIDVGSFDYSVHVVSGHGQIDLTFYPTKVETWRFYLTSYSALVHNALILHGNMGETPNKTIPVSPGALPPGNVTFVGPIVQSIKTDGQNNGYIEVTITYARPSPVGSFLGVDVDVEAPSPSNIIVAVGGFDYANNVDGSGNGVIKLVFYPANDETWRFYLSSYSMSVHNPLVRVGTGASPSQTLLVAKGSIATVGLPPLPDNPSSISAIRGTPPSRQFGTTQELQVQISATFNMPLSTHTATGVAIWLTYDNTATPVVWFDVGAFPVTPNTTPFTILFWWDAPTIDSPRTQVKAITFNDRGWNLISSARASGTFLVTTSAAVGAGVITDAVQLGSFSASPQTVIIFSRASDGTPYWGFQCKWSNPDPAAQPNWRLTKLKVQKWDTTNAPPGNALGNAAADYEGKIREQTEYDTPATLITHTVASEWPVLPTGSPFRYRVTLWCTNHFDVDALQTGAWGAAAQGHNDYLELYPQDPGFSTTSGIEKTGLVTVGTGPNTPKINYVTAEDGGVQWNVSGTFTKPPNDPTYGGTVVWVRSSTGVDTMVVDQETGAFQGPNWPVGASDTYTAYFVSYDKNTLSNSLNPQPGGNTPFTALGTVARQPYGATAGVTNAPLVLNFNSNVGDGNGAVIPVPDDAGVTNWIVTGRFKFPTIAGGSIDPKFGGAKIVRMSQNPVTNADLYIECCNIPKGNPVDVNGYTNYRSQLFPPAPGFTLIIAALSYDTSGRINSYTQGSNPANAFYDNVTPTPQFTIVTPAQAQTLNIAKADPATFVTASIAAKLTTPRIIASGGAFPTLPAAGQPTDPNWPIGSYIFMTDFQSMFKTLDGHNWTPQVTQTDIAINTIIAVQIQAAQISSREMAVQELLVGSPTNVGPTRFRVNDTSANMIGFVGDIPNGFNLGNQTVSTGFKGAYFINLRVGNSVNTPYFYADGSKVVMGLNNNVFVNSAGVTLQDTPLTMSSNTAGISIQTNGQLTQLNNVSSGGFLYGFTCEDTGKAHTVAIATTHIFMVANNRVTPRLTLDSNGPSVIVYDTAGQEKIQLNGGLPAIAGVQNQGPARIFVKEGFPTLVYREGLNARVQYVIPGGATFHMSFVAGIMVESASGALTQDEIAAGMVEPPSWFELMEERVAALEAALKGRNN